MRFFFGSLQTETNTFAPFPTGLASFSEGGLFRGNGSSWGSPAGLTARALRDRIEADGHVLHESLQAEAQPSGRVLRAVYESLRDELLADLAASGPFDAVFLFLHGAMAADGYDDCEGDIIARAREILGHGVPIGVELDLHCHLTAAMIEAATVIAIIREYPHTDYVARAMEMYEICLATARGEVQPASAMFDCRMIGFYPTTAAPMRELVDSLAEVVKRPGILTAAIAHGFPWADVADIGTRILVVADNDRALAEATAREIGMRMYAMRDALSVRFPDMAAAVATAMAEPGLTVLGDTADNPGGGAPGDATYLLRHLIEAGVEDAAIGFFWDPVVVSLCHEAEVGACFPIRLGGKSGPASGEPIDLLVTVRGIACDHGQIGPSGGRREMGDAVWLSIDGGIDIGVCSRRIQTFSPDAFSGLGIDLAGKRIVAVKSSHHFYARFAPIADRVIHVATPGAMPMAFATMAYTKRDGDYYPRVQDPLAVDPATPTMGQ
jgi:microcystin degradation protein MlrC